MQNNTSVNSFTPIDLRQVFREKNPGMARFIPGFVFGYLRRILHINSINEFLLKHGEKQGLEFIQAVIRDFNVHLEVKGEENLPHTGKYIFVSNHPLGGFDGILLMHTIGKVFPVVKSISNDILMNMKNLSGNFIPVNKHGSQTHDIVHAIDEAFDSDCQIISFPAGLVSRRRKGVIRDVQWKKSFITKAVQHKRDVIPIHMTGRCTNFFYKLANLRKFLGIKTNIEMFLLPDETFRHRNSRIVITIGKPIPWSTFDKRYPATKWAIIMQNYVYTLPENPEAAFESFILQNAENKSL